jgi:sugar (pentulose or hexulose) kinase
VADRQTGLLADPYFSATKLYWLLEHVRDARKRAEAGELCFGTIDSWLIYKLTGGKVHATDATNASRTLLFNIHTQTWDERAAGATLSSRLLFCRLSATLRQIMASVIPRCSERLFPFAAWQGISRQRRSDRPALRPGA